VAAAKHHKKIKMKTESKKNLIPQFILEKYNKNILSGSFRAAVMFIDISGFTAMTQRLMKNGKEGAEILTSVINNVFTPSIDAIYDYDGFISTFAGDAFTAVFPKKLPLALSSAAKINQIFSDIGIQKTKFGDFELSVKIGLSAGTVNWGIIKADNLNTYFMRGMTIDAAAESEHHCEKGEIIANKDFYKLNIPNAVYEKVETDFYKLTSFESITSAMKDNEFSAPALTDFVPKNIIDLKIQGEFRDIVSCFISFKDEDYLLQNISLIMNLVHKYGGYFNKLDFGDKGGVILVIFGAPTALEKMYKRACDFAFEVRNLVNFKTRIGLTFGTVFAGFVGSKVRSEYTALGMVVNLSARYMMKANWNDIYIDRYISTNIKDVYEFKYLNEQVFKGFSEKIPVYELTGKKEQLSKNVFKGKFIGRESEIKTIQKYVKPLSDGKFGGLIYVDGAAGIGKSRLLSEFLNELLKESFHWFYLPCDGILHNSFNPFIHFFKAYFQRSNNNSEKTNRDNFDRNLQLLCDITTDPEIKTELIRTKSFLGALINLYWKNSLFEQVDAKSRYENTIYAVKNFIKAVSLYKPLIIEIDDAHFIDPDSQKLLKVLCTNVGDIPFTLIAACRKMDDGSDFNFVFEQEQVNRLEISPLSMKDTKILSLAAFKAQKGFVHQIPDETFNLIWEKSEGNPFYIEQIILYLLENDLVDADLQLTQTQIEIPSQINSIIISRIDKLTTEIKDTIKTASILGKEFYATVLSNMLRKLSSEFDSKIISRQIQEGVSHKIWDQIGEIIYIFSSALIRDSVYEIQLKQRLRYLHKIAAESIEHLFKQDLKEYFSVLAFHYEKAEIDEKALEYLGKAGDYAKYNFLNETALDFFERKIKIYEKLIDLSKKDEEHTKDYIDTLFEKKYIQVALGNLTDAEKTILKTKELADSINDPERSGKFYLDYANIQKSTGKLEDAKINLQNALEIFRKSKNKEMLGLTYLDLGVVSCWSGKNEEALSYFSQELEIFTEIDNKRRIADALGNIGVVHRYLGNLSKAMDYLDKQRNLSIELNDKLQLARTSGNIGWIYEGEGDFNKALSYYEESLKINKKMGLISEIVRIQDNIGYVYQMKKEFDTALKYHSLALKSAVEIGDTNSIININANIGHAYKALSHFSKSIKFYNEGIKLAQKGNLKSFLPELFIEKAELCLKQNKIEEAKELCGKGLKLAEETNNTEYIEKGKDLQKRLTAIK